MKKYRTVVLKYLVTLSKSNFPLMFQVKSSRCCLMFKHQTILLRGTKCKDGKIFYFLEPQGSKFTANDRVNFENQVFHVCKNPQCTRFDTLTPQFIQWSLLKFNFLKLFSLRYFKFILVWEIFCESSKIFLERMVHGPMLSLPTTLSTEHYHPTVEKQNYTKADQRSQPRLQSMALFAEISGAESQRNSFSGVQNHFQVWKNVLWQDFYGIYTV